MRTRGIEANDSPPTALDPSDAASFESAMASPHDTNQALVRHMAVEAAIQP